MKKVLLISPDMINKKMAGPAIRYYNFAMELSKDTDVTLFIPNKSSDLDFSRSVFSIIKGDIEKLKDSASNVDSIIVQGIALRLYPFLKEINKPIVVDIYDPITLENLELRKKVKLHDRLLYHETDLDLILEQLAFGDYFICASEKQKDYWLGMLAALNRVNPCTYIDDANMDKLIGVVPFGMDNSDPIKSKNVLKGVWKGIKEDDKVLIWGGGIWNWFDPMTLIEAMNCISKERSDVKLFFMGIGHPSANVDISVATECIERSKELGLYDTSIFFNDWVPYEERQDYLMEADIGISTYFNNLETRFSFRTRILDYLWCDLPMVLTEGDFMADMLKREKIGLCHREGNYEELKDAIIYLLDNESMYKEYKNNIGAIKEEFRWANVVNPLKKFCMSPYISVDKLNKVKIFYDKGNISRFQYYYVRIKNKLKSIIKKILRWK